MSVVIITPMQALVITAIVLGVIVLGGVAVAFHAWRKGGK